MFAGDCSAGSADASGSGMRGLGSARFGGLATVAAYIPPGEASSADSAGSVGSGLGDVHALLASLCSQQMQLQVQMNAFVRMQERSNAALSERLQRLEHMMRDLGGSRPLSGCGGGDPAPHANGAPPPASLAPQPHPGRDSSPARSSAHAATWPQQLLDASPTASPESARRPRSAGGDAAPRPAASRPLFAPPPRQPAGAAAAAADAAAAAAAAAARVLHGPSEVASPGSRPGSSCGAAAGGGAPNTGAPLLSASPSCSAGINSSTLSCGGATPIRSAPPLSTGALSPHPRAAVGGGGSGGGGGGGWAGGGAGHQHPLSLAPAPAAAPRPRSKPQSHAQPQPRSRRPPTADESDTDLDLAGDPRGTAGGLYSEDDEGNVSFDTRKYLEQMGLLRR